MMSAIPYLPLGWVDTRLVPYKQPDSEDLSKKKLEITTNAPKDQLLFSELAPNGPVGPHKPELWKAIDWLASGRHGEISLWEWHGEYEADPNNGRWAILKTPITPVGDDEPYDQMMEGLILDQLIRERRTDHLVPIIYHSADFSKLYLEYCFNGDLQEDIVKRRNNESGARYYSEQQLWRMFLCLVRGSMSLSGERSLERVELIVHFDLKPENIYLGDAEDKTTPDESFHNCHGGEKILKIGDFSDAHAFRLDARETFPEGDLLKDERVVGSRGSRRYRSPEQRALMGANPFFDLDWDGWEDWESEYGYSAATNIWGIGAIMWQAITLNTHSPYQSRKENGNRFDYRYDRRPDGTTRDRPLSRMTYGPEINSDEVKARYPYRDSLLIHLVLLCLMEFPRRRPTNEQIFNAITEVCTAYDDGRLTDPPPPGSLNPEEVPISSIIDSTALLQSPSTTRWKNSPGSARTFPMGPAPRRPPKAPPRPGPPPPQSITFPEHPDKVPRSWTGIPAIKAVPNPWTAADPHTPISPNTVLPEGFRPYEPRTPTTPGTDSSQSTPPRRPSILRTAANPEAEIVYSPRSRMGEEGGGRGRRPPKPPRHSSRGISIRPHRRYKLRKCFFCPCDCFFGILGYPYGVGPWGKIFWYWVFWMGVLGTGFCLLFNHLVEFEKHI